MVDTKVCGTCGIEKSVNDFYKRGGKPRSYCKSCSNSGSKDYRTRNSEKVKKKKKEYYEENKTEVLSKHKQYYSENRDKKLAYAAGYREEHKEEIAEKRKDHYKRNKERVLKINAAYRRSERGKSIKNICNARRRASQKNAEGSFSLSEWETRLSEFDSKCAYCGSAEDIQKDHFVALNSGGTNNIENIVPACSSCNASKQDNDPIKWYESRPYFDKGKLEFIINITSAC